MFDINATLDPAENTALHIAVSQGDTAETLSLLKKGANVNKQNTMKLSPLHLALQKGHSHLIDHLMFYGANIEISAMGGYRPIHTISVSPNKKECLDLLVKHKVDIDAKDDYGNTLLQTMILWGCNCTSLIQALIDYGADPNLTDLEGNNCLHYLCSKKLYMGDVDKKSVAMKILPKMFDVDTKNNTGETPLFLACKSNDVYMVRELLQKNASVLAECSDKLTPFDVALKKGSRDVLKKILQYIALKQRREGHIEDLLLARIESNGDSRILFKTVKKGKIGF